MEAIKRLVRVDQKPIGRTPRSNLATYTGLFDHVRKLFAATKAARARRYDAGRFSFNVAKGRCETCEGEGFVMVELLFLPSVYAPCPTCHGARYNAKTLEIRYRGKNIAEVLAMTVDAAWEFFADEPQLHALAGRAARGRPGLPATRPARDRASGGEAQRIKLATELQRMQRGDTLYILDEPTTGLHPSDVEKLMTQLEGWSRRQHRDRRRARHAGRRRSDWVIDIGPGAGEEGGVSSRPARLAIVAKSKRVGPRLISPSPWAGERGPQPSEVPMAALRSDRKLSQSVPCSPDRHRPLRENTRWDIQEHNASCT